MNVRTLIIITGVVIVLVAAITFVPAVFAQGPGSGYGPGNGTGPMTGEGFGPGSMHQGGMGPGYGADSSLIAIVADTLGLERSELIAQLQDGATVADLAGDNLDTIIDTFVADRAARLDAAVDAGTLTQEEADARLAAMREHLSARLNQEWTFQPGARLHAPEDMPRHQMHNFADTDGDGVCDNMNGGQGFRPRGGR